MCTFASFNIFYFDFLGIIHEYIEAQHSAPQTAVFISDITIAFREKNTAIFTPISDKLGTCENMACPAMSVEEDQYDYAVALAEKYLDSHRLLIISDKTDDEERLNVYVLRFEYYDFLQFAST